MCPGKLTLVVAIILSGLLRPAAGAPPEGKEPARTDASGDPLPPGAVLRLGTGRFRHAGAFAFLPDGRTIVSRSEGNSFRFWETATGKLLGELETGEANSQG